ncbi:MAG: tail fiber domain-containing protein, partial [Patescibacteria group bacterium]|nr:tail fiber domain-containing protein [Patescibacteria group bacterium]
VIGNNVQAYNSNLATLAGLSTSPDYNFIISKSGSWGSFGATTAKTYMGLGSVENTALSTWGGSANISTLGTVGTGIWHGSVIDTLYLNSSVMLSGENISSLTNDANYVTTTQATSLAKAAISTSGLALNYANGVISVATNYNIPLTASTTNWNNAYNIVNASSTNWNNFYNTPSGRISLGTGLIWSGNTIQANTGYNIPLTASTTNWQTAFSWGNHADANYLTTETDPIWTAVSSTYLATTTASNTYLSIANNLSDLNSSSTARTNLGLVIGTNVQAYNSNLATLAGLSTSPDYNFIISKSGSWGSFGATTAKTYMGLGSVENTALSTWTGNTSISSIGTITTGTWQGNAIASTYLASNVMLSGENISSLTNDANYVTTTQATSLAKAAISTSGLALNYADGVISVASGYNIPLTASTTNWNNFYNTPSGRISLGTGLTWSDNTIQADGTHNIPLTVSTTDWQTAFSWGDHSLPGYLVASSNLSELTNTSTARTNLGLGTLALQNVNGVAITGGSINGTTIGATTPSTAVFTNATSTNLSYSGGLSTPFTQGSIVFAGANGVLSENNSGLYFDSSTNRLGIGTTNPGYDVEVSGSMRLWESASTTTLVVRAGALQNLSTTPYVFEVLDTTGGRLGGIRIDGYSAAKIFSTADSVSAAISQAGVGYSPGFNLNTSSGIAWASAGQWYAAKDTSISRIAAGKVGIGTGAIGNYSGALLVGSIGINTSTPGYSLTIAGVSSATASSIYISPSTDGTSERASLTLDNWEVGQDYNANGSKDFYIKDSASSTSRFFISKDGNIGVGTTTPQSAFHLASGNFTQTVGSDPTIVGGIVGDMKLYETTSVFVSGDYAYITSEYDDSLSILNISDYNNVTTTGYIKDTTNLNAASFVFVSGDYAYVASSLNYSMAIINISNPASPIMVSVIKSTDELSDIRSIHISGNYAYVVDSASNLFSIIDISNPLNPIIVSSIKSSVSTSGATSAYVSGKYAYVTNYVDRSLNIIDISNPTDLSIVGGIEDVVNLDSPRSVYVSGRYAYVIIDMGDSFRIIDISNPVAPSIVGGIQDSVNLNDPSSIKVYGNYAYVLSKVNNSMAIIDISNPAFPSIVADIKDDLELNSPVSLAVSGKRAYILNRYGYPSGKAFTIVDLTGVEAPTANIGNIQSNNINVTDNFNVGNNSYLNGGLVVGGNSWLGGALSINGSFKQTVGSDPVVVSTLSSATYYNGASSIYVSGNYVYVTNQTGDSLSITDVSNPNNPSVVGYVQDLNATLNGANSVYVSGKYAYVANFENDSLRVIDVSNPASPSIIGGIASSTALNGAWNVAVSGNRAYVANSIGQSMRIIDISNPAAPMILGGVTSSIFTSYPYKVFVSGKYAYVGTDSATKEFHIIDISDSNNPVEVGSLNMPSSIGDIYVSGKYAYVGTSNSTGNDFHIINISNPATPVEVGSLSFSSGLGPIYVSGNYAYVKRGVYLTTIDISSSTLPVAIGSKNVGYGLLDVSGNYAYHVNDGILSVINLTGIEAPNANIGSIQSDNIKVTDNFSVGNDSYLNGGLMVGGNSLFSGAMSLSGGLTLTDATSSTATTVDLKFNNNTTTQWTMQLDKSNNDFRIKDSSGSFGAYLTQGVSGWTNLSDERLKDNIMDLNVLDRIDNYRAVSFDWKSNGSHDIGAIAQELYNIFPEAVSVGKEELGPLGEGSWGIQYSKLGALALQGVKELKQRLDVYNALLLSGSLNSFVDDMNQSNILTFSQDVAFTKHVTFSKDNIGSALILAGENGVRVEFVQEFVTPPIVNLTLASDATLDTYFVDSVDTTGFTIRIRPLQSQDVVINWYAFGQVFDNLNQNSTDTTEVDSGSGADNLTDLANNYLEDNGLTLDDTMTSSTTTSSTDNVLNIDDNLSETTTTTIDETTTSTNN